MSAPPTLSRMNFFWLVHVVMELPTGLMGFWTPQNAPIRGLGPAGALVVRVRISLTAQRLLPDRVKHCVSSSVWPSRLPSRKACLCGTTTLLPRATHGRVPPGRPITRVHRVATMGALAVPAGHRDSIHQDNRRVARHSCVDNCGLVAGRSTGSTACATNERQDKVGL